MPEIYPENAVILAPLAGFTDLPFRRSARRFGCRYAFTEMIDAGSLVYGSQKTFRFLERGDDEPWLGVQLTGSEPDILTGAAEITNRHPFDVLDFNLGCPAPKVIRKGEGAALAERPDAVRRALDALVRTSRSPVTVKMRILNETDPESSVRLAELLEDCGIQALTVHGRVRQAYYSGPVFLNIIAEIKRHLSINVVANGGIVNEAVYRHTQQETGCSRVMLATGVMGNPWLFRQIQGRKDCHPPTVVELSAELCRHVHEMVDYYGEEHAFRVSRKLILAYLKGRGYPGAVKVKVSSLKSNRDFADFMRDIEKGPSNRYWQWLRSNPESEARLSLN